jgi:hypothetical protein
MRLIFEQQQNMICELINKLPKYNKIESKPGPMFLNEYDER